jgi:hypothetical protein
LFVGLVEYSNQVVLPAALTLTQRNDAYIVSLKYSLTAAADHSGEQMPSSFTLNNFYDTLAYKKAHLCKI